MGSAGRGECLLAPDQDNGFILADYDDAAHPRIDAYFVPLAERFTQLLDAIRIPLCLGNVMATNPVGGSGSRMAQAGHRLAAQAHGAQLLLSDILVDFQHVWGDAALSQALRRHIMQAIAGNPTFVRDLFTIEAGHGARSAGSAGSEASATSRTGRG